MDKPSMGQVKPRIEIKKVLKIGKSYYVSLPRDWVEENLSPDDLTVAVFVDKTVVIVPSTIAAKAVGV